MIRPLPRLALSLAASLLALALGAGCASRRFPYPEAPTVSAKHLRALGDLATQDLVCPEEELDVSPMASRLFHVEGCERASDYLFLCAYGHCRFREVGSLRARAAFDLECEEAFEVTALGGNAWGVAGCGSRATYVAACGVGEACAWVPADALPTFDAVEGAAPAEPTLEPAPDAGPSPSAPEPPASEPAGGGSAG